MQSRHDNSEAPRLPVDEQTLRQLQELVEFLGILDMPTEVQDRVGPAIVKIRLQPPWPRRQGRGDQEEDLPGSQRSR